MKTILLAVCGLTPQVITETLYALHQRGTPVDAIRILTTRPGKDACLTGLFGAGDGHFHRYLREYAPENKRIDFAPRHVRSVAGPSGAPIDDIAGSDDNEAFLKACLEAAFEHTASEDNRVLFSIAGGRKTMGACLSLAAQFYGRPQDRMYHVLVSPEFESNRNFYYPPAKPRRIELRDAMGQPCYKSTRYARVTLAPLPFISVRDRISDGMLKKPEPPSALLLSLVREREPELVVDCRNRKLIYRGLEMDMMPARLALYAFFALQKKRSDCATPDCKGCDACLLTLVEILDRLDEIAKLYATVGGTRLQGRMSDSGIMALSAENFNSYKSKIRTDLEKAFGPYELPRLEIASQGQRPDTRYGITMKKDRIKVVM